MQTNHNQLFNILLNIKLGDIMYSIFDVTQTQPSYVII